MYFMVTWLALGATARRKEWGHSETYTTGKKYGIIFISSSFFVFLWVKQGVFVFEKNSYEQILLLGELIST